MANAIAFVNIDDTASNDAYLVGGWGRSIVTAMHGGVINYYGWSPRFVNESGAALSGVNVRAHSNVPLATPALPADISRLAGAITRSATIDRTGLAYNVINQYTTNAAGLVDLTNATYSTCLLYTSPSPRDS